MPCGQGSSEVPEVIALQGGSTYPQDDEGISNRNDPSPSPEQSPEQLQDRDFGKDADELWSLFGKEVKKYDESWTNALKEDVDAILIFVCVSLFCSASVDDQFGFRLVYSLLFSPLFSSQRFRI